MLHYILQTLAFQVFFLIIYDVFLKNETFFNWNRAYLIITAVLSFIVPFLKFETIKAMVPEPMVIRLPEVIIGEVSPLIIDGASMMESEQLSASAIIFSWTYVWLVGMVLAALILAYKLFKISVLLQRNPKRWKGNVVMVYLMNSHSAFSFFHYIFLGNNIEADKKEHILQHEMVHIEEKHSVDLLVFEMLRIMFWFNPLIYMYQNRIATLHEFIADAKAVKYKEKSDYYQSLLSQVFETQQISFINPFFNQSLIKKRIVMLSKSKSKQIHLIKYALLVPAVMAMLMYTSSYASEVKDSFPILQKEVSNQELTLQELVEKYYNEIVASGKSMDALAGYDGNLDSEDMYIESIEKVARRQALMKYFLKRIRSEREKDSSIKEADKDKYEKLVNRYETYEDYLAYKKTDLAKESWESMAPMGELRLVVDDMGKLSEAEQKRKKELTGIIDKDEVYSKFHMTDGKLTTVLDKGKNRIKITKATSAKEKNEESSSNYDIEVPYAVIEEVPKFKGCENLASNEEIKLCTSDKVSMFVNNNFNLNLATELGLTGRQRISVIFKIGKDGKVKNVKARAPHPGLEAEAVRVINLLPDFTPGKQRGKAVTVPYSLPILFQVQANPAIDEAKETVSSEQEYLQKLESKEQNDVIIGVEVPYAVVDEVPIYPSCEDMDSKASQKQCTSDKISQFVNQNFNTNLAKELGLTGKQRISVIFKIGEDGVISDIRARASHPDLEKEIARVIEALPKMQPGKQKGKPVVVPFSLPILFQVQ